MRTASSVNPVDAFTHAATVPRDAHNDGTLEEANRILAMHPEVATTSIYTAAILGDDATVKGLLAETRALAAAKGGVNHWDPLTYLCFSRYLRLDRARSDAFVRTARILLEAGAPADTGWDEVIDRSDAQPGGRTIVESAIYGAAGVAQHAGVTQLLLEYGADPNDEETPYHVPESDDHTVMNVMLASGKLNPTSLSWMLVRKADWHDEAGMRLLLEHGADPNLITRWGNNALQHSVLRDNHLPTIKLLLDHGADPTKKSPHSGRNAISIAARRGRGDILNEFADRGFTLGLLGLDGLIAACARNDRATMRSLMEQQPGLVHEMIGQGGTLLTEFAGAGNAAGVRNLLDIGIRVDALYPREDGYWQLAKHSTALHNAAWRARHAMVKELIARGAGVNAVDSEGRTPLMLAVKACVDSPWISRRTTESVQALLAAGAPKSGIKVPCGYDEVDRLLS